MYTRAPNSVNPALIHCGKIQHFIVRNQYSWICQTSTPVRWQSIFCFNRKIVYRPSTSYTTKVAPETNYLMMILVWQSRAIWRAVKLSKLQRGVHYLWCKRDRLNSTTWPINNPEQSSVEHQGWPRFVEEYPALVSTKFLPRFCQYATFRNVVELNLGNSTNSMLQLIIRGLNKPFTQSRREVALQASAENCRRRISTNHREEWTCSILLFILLGDVGRCHRFS